MIYEISYSNQYSNFSKKEKFDPYEYLGFHKFKYTNDLHHRFYPPVRMTIYCNEDFGCSLSNKPNSKTRIVSGYVKNPILVKF